MNNNHIEMVGNPRPLSARKIGGKSIYLIRVKSSETLDKCKHNGLFRINVSRAAFSLKRKQIAYQYATQTEPRRMCLRQKIASESVKP